MRLRSCTHIGKSLDSSNENGGISLICCFTFPFSCTYLICPLPACASLSRSPAFSASFRSCHPRRVLERHCAPLRLRGFAHDLARCGLAFPCLAFHPASLPAMAKVPRRMRRWRFEGKALRPAPMWQFPPHPEWESPACAPGKLLLQQGESQVHRRRNPPKTWSTGRLRKAA